MIEKVNLQELIKDRLNNYNSILSDIPSKIKKTISNIQSKIGQTRSIIGIDIGASSVKLAHMVNLEGELVLTKTAVVDIETEGQEFIPQEVMLALKKALAGIDTKGEKIVSVINCPSTLAMQIVIPHMPVVELPEAIKWEIKNYLPFSVDEALIDFEITGEVFEKDVKKTQVCVAATPKGIVDRQLALFSQLGLKVSAVVPASIALKYLISKSSLQKNKTIAIVELGASLTELNIYKDAQLEFSRKIPLSGVDITRGLTTSLISAQGRVELTMEEAERVKLEYGLPQHDSQELIEGRMSYTQVRSLVRPKIERLVNEIERSFDYYCEGMSGGKVDSIILYGGGAKMKGLVQFLSSELSMEVKVGNPLEDIKAISGAVPEQDKISHRLNLAAASALSESKGINLLPKELKEEKKRFIEKVSLKSVIVFIITSLALFYIGLRVQQAAYDKKIQTAQIEYRAVTRQLEEMRDEILIDQLLRDRPDWQEALKELSNVIPPSIYLTYLNMEKNTLSLKGVITQKAQVSETALSNFMFAMEKGIFNNVILINTRKKPDNQNISEFEIKCGID